MLYKKALKLYGVALAVIMLTSIVGVSTAKASELTADQLYANAYSAVSIAKTIKTQKSINVARIAVESLSNTKASWAIGEFSKQVDQIQQPILVMIIESIDKAKSSPSQANVNGAKASIDSDLPQLWKNSYSSAIDDIEKALQQKADTAYNTAIRTNLKSDIDLANGLLEEIKTSTDAPVSTWASTLQAKLYATTTLILNKTSDVLAIGGTDTLIETFNPTTESSQAITWTSSNNTIVTVDNTGKIIGNSSGVATITAITTDGSKTGSCIVAVNNTIDINKNGYVNNSYVNLRSFPSVQDTTLVGKLYDFTKVNIVGDISDTPSDWYKVTYGNDFAYVSRAYITDYTSPPSNILDISRSITKEFETGNLKQISGNFDGAGLSLGYFQWCIGGESLQPLLARMDSEHNDIMKQIFGTNYYSIHSMLGMPLQQQLQWAININDTQNNIKEPWNTQLVNLYNTQEFQKIENDAEVILTNNAMKICDAYKLKTVRGFALAFDIATQNGSINQGAETIINSAINQDPNMKELELLKVIANAVADSSTINTSDVRARKMAIVNGEGTVHESILYLDRDYSLSDNSWR